MSSEPLRFVAADHADARRVAWARRLLIGLGGPVLVASAGSPLGDPALRTWAAAVRRALRMRLEITGVQPDGGPWIVTPLHEGLTDAIVLADLGLPMTFLARDELFGWPLLGPYLRRGRHIQVPTTPTRRHLRRLDAGVGAALDDGRSVVAFPQGSVLGIEAAFSRGPFRLAATHGTPILPVLITGTHRVWEHPFSPTVRTGVRVSMHVMEPIRPGEAIARAAWLERSMKELALSGRFASPRRYVPSRDGFWDGYDVTIDPTFEAVHDEVAAHRERGVRPVTSRSPGDGGSSSARDS